MVYDIDYRVGPEYISPSQEGQIPISIHATQQVLSNYLRDTFYDHPFIVCRLITSKLSSGTKE
jgi:hypothetical protein